MEKKSKFSLWMKKYGAYTLAGVLVLAMAVTILFTGLNSTGEKSEISSANNPVVSVNAQPLTFSMPMENATLIKDFSSAELFLNSTLGRWEFHNGIDLVSSDLKVYAIADGTITAITSDSLNGTKIEVTHTNKLKSVYGSLSSNVAVSVGDKIEKGDELGIADATATSEENDGKHLHFEMLENDKNIDPANYLEFEVK